MKTVSNFSRVGLSGLLAGLVAISILIIPACDNESTEAPDYDPNGILVHYSECKQFKSLAATETPPTRDCVEYRYLEPGLLILTHVNAGFNCCPGQIFADITIRNDTITIVERERESACRCLCLYDLEYRFPEMPAGTYTIKIAEPYIDAEDVPINFTVDLVRYAAGSFCATRDHYPWETGGGSEEPFSYFISYRGCVAGQYIPALETVPPDLDCVEYRGTGTGTLLLNHFNAAFNCCAGLIGAAITISNDTITVAEQEESSPCDCQCLFELQCRIMQLDSRRYTVKITEPYVRPGDEQLVFGVDPADAPLNFRAAYRDRYPWHYAGSFEQDTTAIEKMRRSIRQYAAWYNHCSSEGECRYIAFGAKPCGGPREYIIYSTAYMDVDYFRRSVCRFNEIEYAFNRRYGIASPCDVPPLPNPGCIEGACADLNGD